MTGSFRRLGQGTLGLLLFGAVLSPVVAEALGRPAYPPVVAMAAAGVTVVLAAVTLRATQRPAAVCALYAALALVMAVPLGTVLHAQTNSFYTSGALFGGMVVLLFLHVAAVVMRHVAMRDDEPPRDHTVVTALSADARLLGAVERLPPNEIRMVRTGRSLETDEPGRWRRRGDPAIALNDALADGAAWLLVSFWVLVALGHRHVASGALLLVGALLAGRCLALLPDVLAPREAGTGTERA